MKISPSILDANFQNLQKEIDSVSTANRIHLDIMDGHYVPNLSYGATILKSIKFSIKTEAHLMVNDPDKFFGMFLDLGASTITFHIENTGQAIATTFLRHLKSNNVKAGICVDGYTDTNMLSGDIIDLADQILLMSVKAGFGGQKFMPEVVEKIKNLRNRGYKNEIEVDGGINLDNAKLLKDAGADIIVVGSFLMKKIEAERKAIIQNFQNI